MRLVAAAAAAAMVQQLQAGRMRQPNASGMVRVHVRACVAGLWPVSALSCGLCDLQPGCTLTPSVCVGESWHASSPAYLTCLTLYTCRLLESELASARADAHAQLAAKRAAEELRVQVGESWGDGRVQCYISTQVQV